MRAKPYHVYILIDPLSDEVFYVGITDDPHTRFLAHCLMSQGKNPQKSERIQQIRAAQLEPIMQIVETVQGKLAARIREKYWIAWYTQERHPLTNILCLPRKATQARKIKQQSPNIVAAHTYTAKQAMERLEVSPNVFTELVQTGIVTPSDKFPDWHVLGFKRVVYSKAQIERLAAKFAS